MKKFFNDRKLCFKAAKLFKKKNDLNASNGGRDNAEGILIVAVGDALAPSPPGDHVYRVCRLLGQGTFA